MGEEKISREIKQTDEELEVKVLKENPANKRSTGFKAVFTKDTITLQKL